MNDPLAELDKIFAEIAAADARANRPQLTRADLDTMTPAEIVAAKNDGLLNTLLGRPAAN
ncbi:hypothetical protein [Streptomyces sp. NPDC058441]|uniref:hypothetical protein n=1 Tax=Streptomyces sp. NPDC058441 TaxID=3346502 RepID=UPI00365FC139